MPFEDVKRLLVFAAHPDDETIGCAGLLQRVPASLVVFAVDAAPAGYGFERKFGSLRNYSEERFKEAGRALGHLSNSAFQRLKTRNGAYFADRKLFQNLEEAGTSLLGIAQGFLADAIVSHAFESGHIDHDACSFLAAHAANTLSLRHFEFPLYWKNKNGQDVFQEFRDAGEGAICLELSEAEIAIKKKMLAEYQSQREIVAMFLPDTERFRQAPLHDYVHPAWKLSYPGNWRMRWDARAARQRFADFGRRVAMG